MNFCDVYIIAPVVKLTDNDNKSPINNILKIHEVITRITKIYKTKVDIYSLTKIKINSISESYKQIDLASCIIIITPYDNVQDFMILIGHAISRNKKICILLLNNTTKEFNSSYIIDGYKDLFVELFDESTTQQNILKFIEDSIRR